MEYAARSLLLGFLVSIQDRKVWAAGDIHGMEGYNKRPRKSLPSDAC